MSRLPATFITLAFLLAAGAVQASPPYPQRPAVRAFIAEMADKHGFSKKELERLFGRVHHQPAVIKAIKPLDPGARSWQEYQARFVNPERIQAGVRFWERNAEALARAELEYGVPREIVVAIIGVETQYGRHTGRYRVIDALTTLAFDYPPRAEFFRTELENYLLFTRETGRDPFKLKGSYAGAIGIPQFMPGSYRRYAVDFDSDGQANLAASASDAVGSTANFLRSHGWEPGQPVALPARVAGEPPDVLIEADLRPSILCAGLGLHGVAVSGEPPADASCSLIELATPNQASEYLAGLHNFWVITRYNRSSFYAAAVNELATAVKSEYGRTR